MVLPTKSFASTSDAGAGHLLRLLERQLASSAAGRARVARPIPIDCDLESYGVSLEAVQTGLADKAGVLFT